MGCSRFVEAGQRRLADSSDEETPCTDSLGGFRQPSRLKPALPQHDRQSSQATLQKGNGEFALFMHTIWQGVAQPSECWQSLSARPTSNLTRGSAAWGFARSENAHPSAHLGVLLAHVGVLVPRAGCSIKVSAAGRTATAM